LDNTTTHEPEAQIRALEQNEEKTFKELTGYFAECSQNNQLVDIDKIHDLLHQWIEARLLRIVEVKKGLQEFQQLLREPKHIAKINEHTKATDILEVETALAVGIIDSDFQATFSFLTLMFSVFQSLALAELGVSRKDANEMLADRTSRYSQLLQGGSEVLKALQAQTPLVDPVGVYERFKRMILKDDDEQKGGEPP